MSNKTYDILKYICQVLLPAVGTFIFALSEIWHFAYASQIVGTITAVDALMGALLKVSSDRYYESRRNGDAE